MFIQGVFSFQSPSSRDDPPRLSRLTCQRLRQGRPRDPGPGQRDCHGRGRALPGHRDVTSVMAPGLLSKFAVTSRGRTLTIGRPQCMSEV